MENREKSSIFARYFIHSLIMCTRERALQLGQKIEVIEDAERRIAEYEKKHGKPMNRTMQGALMLRGLIEVYDKTLLL